MTISSRLRPAAGPIFLACLMAAFLAVTHTAVSSAPSPAMDGAKPGQLVRLPDGRRINLRCLGAGSPTVLLEGGYAATSMAWSSVEPRVAKLTRVCAYDRAGAGFSDPGPLPRDGTAIALDLDQALRAARIPGPFVVVGHSAGGLYVRLFARRRRGEVVGMVLVDPSIEHQDRRLSAIFGPGAGSLEALKARANTCLDASRRGALPSLSPELTPCAPPPRTGEPAALAAEETAENTRATTWRTRLSELDALWGATSDELDRGDSSLDAMPLIVLTAGGSYADAPAAAKERLAAAWAGFHRQLAGLSSRGSAQLVPESSHLIMRDRPDVVVDAIVEVIAADRSRSVPPRH